MAVVFMLLLKPVAVNDPSDALKINPYRNTEPAYLEYLDFQNEIVTEGTPWKDMFTVIVIIFIVVVIIIQFFSVMLADRETKSLLDASDLYHAKVEDVTKFYKDTSETFNTLEKNIKDVKGSHKKAEELTSQGNSCAKYSSDFEFMRVDWKEQYEAFKVFGIDLGERRIMDDTVVKAQLAMTRGFVEKELREIRRNVEEDELSLREAERDARALQKYLGK